MKKPLLQLFLVQFMFCCTISYAQQQTIVGWIEPVGIGEDGFQMLGKIDSGARNSSINAPNAKIVEKGSEDWVFFSVTNKMGDTIHLEKKVERIASIKRKGADPQERPVIKLGLCLGKVYKEVEVNIVDRTNFEYQLLVGRSFLEADFLIDSSTTNKTQPKCNLRSKPDID